MAKIRVFCAACGNSVSVDENQVYYFCNKCGRRNNVPKIRKNIPTETKQLKKENRIPSVCIRCNGSLTFSEDKESAVCEYCDAVYTNKTVFVSRDETEIQRAELEAEKRKIELEAEERKKRLELEEAEKKRQHNKELEESRVKRVKVLAEVWGWIFCIGMYFVFVMWAVSKHNGTTSIWWIDLLILDITFLIIGLIIIPIRLKRARVIDEPQKERVIVQEKIVYNNNNNVKQNDYIDLGSNANSRSNAGDIAKGVAAGAVIGTGIAARIAFKGIKHILK